MSVEQMRHAISKVYIGAKWQNAVSRMSDNQVIAVYHKFLKEHKL